VGNDKASEDMTSLVDELASLSSKITIEHTVLNRTPSFSINRGTEETGVTFAGLPLGHEFTSLVLALLQVSGRAPKIDEAVAERFGGQMLDTATIENFVSVNSIEGPQLAANLESHVKDYDIDVMDLQRAKSLQVNDYVELELENGATLKSKAVVLSTGASWRKVGVPGEEEFRNKGVAYCPHCDGPLFEGKRVAVIGGGNSGIEAAIDLSGIVEHVTVLEFGEELRADSVLQDRLHRLPNVTVIKQAQTTEITGT